MNEDIRVHVVTYPDRRNLVMRYTDPNSGKLVQRSAGTASQKEAHKRAAKWEAELQEGRYHHPSRLTWDGFRKRHEDEAQPGMASSTRKKVAAVFNLVENVLSPKHLRDLTPSRLSHLIKVMRDRGRSEATIKGHLAHLQSALQWAVRLGMLAKVPKVDKLKRARAQTVMKGRPITGEEFERMLAKVPDALTDKPNRQRKEPKRPTLETVESWKHYLRGLWLSGLRLAESLDLWWDREDRLCVDLSGKRPMLRIPAALEKGNRDRLLPIAPEFAEFLLETPEADRTGRVFRPLPRRPKRTERPGELTAGRTVAAIGKAARVKVLTTSKKAPKTGEVREVIKYASAHDLRRSFGERWARRVMPQVLMELMRHESIETTLRYYVGRNAQATADVLWEAHEKAQGYTLGYIPENGPKKAESPADVSDCRASGFGERRRSDSNR